MLKSIMFKICFKYIAGVKLTSINSCQIYCWICLWHNGQMIEHLIPHCQLSLRSKYQCDLNSSTMLAIQESTFLYSWWKLLAYFVQASMCQGICKQTVMKFSREHIVGESVTSHNITDISLDVAWLDFGCDFIACFLRHSGDKARNFMHWKYMFQNVSLSAFVIRCKTYATSYNLGPPWIWFDPFD